MVDLLFRRDSWPGQMFFNFKFIRIGSIANMRDSNLNCSRVEEDPPHQRKYLMEAMRMTVAACGE